MPDHYAIYITDTGANNLYDFKVIRKNTAITQDTTGVTTILNETNVPINKIQNAVAAVKNNLSDAND